MEESIKKILGAYISRNNSCFVDSFEFIEKLSDNKYKVCVSEIDKMRNTFKSAYYITFKNHGLSIEEIM